MSNWHDCGKDLIVELQKSANNPNVKLPDIGKEVKGKCIQFLQNSLNDNTICISLGNRAIGLSEGPKKGPMNMQDDVAAFEAWALILRTHCGKDVQLALMENVKLPEWPKTVNILLEKYGHYNRFLYRVMKFKEQYGWFSIADKRLEEVVDRFKAAFDNGGFCNNVPENDASSSPGNLEGMVESTFGKGIGEPGELYLKKLTAASARGVDVAFVYRQLPVGLFLGGKADATRVFTGSHSAIDLWGLSEDRTELVIYELKTRNKMAGIITELMFYANYMYDMYIEKEKNHFKPLSPKKSEKIGVVTRNFTTQAVWPKYKPIC